MIFPKSPRWLLVNSKEEGAHHSFGRFYKKAPYSASVAAQVQTVQTYIELEKAAGATMLWTEIYHRDGIHRNLDSTMGLVWTRVSLLSSS